MQFHLEDKVTFTGAILGIASLFFPLITLKPNRVDDGHPLGWIKTMGAEAVVLIIVLCLLLILLSSVFQNFAEKKKGAKGTLPLERILLSPSVLPFIKGSLGCILFLWVLYWVGPGAQRLLTPEIPNGRITLSSGFWIALGAVWMIMNEALRKIPRGWPRGILLCLPLILFLFLLGSGGFSGLSLSREFVLKKSRLLKELGNHLRLAGTAVLGALLLGIPMGILSAKRAKSEKPIFFFLNSVQTIPSLALFGLLIAPLSFLSFKYPFLRRMGVQGVGATPALIALTLYALLPVARNAFIGFSVVDKDTVQAGKGMGMGPVQLFLGVEVPMALPIVLTGIRISVIQAIGNTAVAALIGAGGLGFFIFQGLGQGAPDLILLGVIPVIVLAVLLDRFLELVIKLMVSPGLEEDISADSGEEKQQNQLSGVAGD